MRHHSRTRTRWLRVGVSIALGATVVWAAGGIMSRSRLVAHPGHGLRVVAVHFAHLPTSRAVRTRVCGEQENCRNGEGGVYVVDVISGTLPSHPKTGVILTDERCTADAYGISHCLNRIQLADRSTLLVRNDHIMRRFPCLVPGDVVQLTS